MESNIVSFDMFEHQKENIQPLHEGRSAASLAKAFSPSVIDGPKRDYETEREQFEKKIDAANELDDPIEVWIEYIKWTHETFPQGSSVDSGLIALLEKCTNQFQNTPYYANDPRYLKVWIEYAGYNDNPREIFSFMYQNGIGNGLATFYEEYAHYLESLSRLAQADEVFQMGIECQARPLERLRRRYMEFLHRVENAHVDLNQPLSPAMPVMRPALSTKAFTIVEPADPQQQQQQQPRNTHRAVFREKLTVFSDVSDGSSSVTERTGGWESIGTIAERRKENTVESRQLEGEVMKMNNQQQQQQSVGRQKLSIFRDSGSHSPAPSQPSFKVPALPVGQKPKREEKFIVNMNLLYPTGYNEDISFEELRAKARGFLGPDFTPKVQQHRQVLVPATPSEHRNEENAVQRTPLAPVSREPPPELELPISISKPTTTTQKMPLKESPDSSSRRRPASPTMTVHTRAATDEIYSMFNQPLKCEMDDAIESHGIPDSSDEEEDDDDDDEDDDDDDEEEDDEEEDDDDDGDDDGNDDKIQDAQREDSGHNDDTFSDKGNDVVSANKDEQCNSIKGIKISVRADIKENEENIIQTSDSRKRIIPGTPSQDRPALSSKGYGVMMMTPIVETTESISTVSRSSVRRTGCVDYNADDDFDKENLESSPFIENPVPRKNSYNDENVSFSQIAASKLINTESQLVYVQSIWNRKPIITDLLCNPMDEGVRLTIMNNSESPVTSMPGYFSFKDMKLGRTEGLKKALRSKKNCSPSGTSDEGDIELRGAVYQLKRELGKGAFAPVYLFQKIGGGDIFEESNDKFYAIKMESPASSWEFYIMKEIERRFLARALLDDHLRLRALDSVIKANEMHLFQDTSCLVMEFNEQGTILDLVNLVKADNIKCGNSSTPGLDECLVMFFTVELLRTVEALHTIGVLHGDLKPDNCMLRILPNQRSRSMATLSLIDNDRERSVNSVSAPYCRDGSYGWAGKGICLIDFGRAIDMTAYDHERDVQFIADWKTSSQDCAEMRELRPWTYQVDYQGLASIVHMMLFGKYIETVSEPWNSDAATRPVHGHKYYKITQNFKRYWQQDIWKELFRLLLNAAACTATEKAELENYDENTASSKGLPITKQLRDIRERIEDYLEQSSERGGISLRSSLYKIETIVSTERKKFHGI
ncbi:Mad3/BUB1 homology region 1-domain-containing protein [Dipodascopsis uninucleata]